MKIAIVGSGIAGLTAAYRLHQSGQQVAIFEKENSLGMDAHSRTIDVGGHSVRADVPSRMFNELEWPSLLRLYRKIGVAFKPVSPTQSFGWLNGKTYLKLSTANRPWLLAKSILDSRFGKLVKEARRLNHQGNEDLIAGIAPDQTFDSYLEHHEFDTEFVQQFLFPTLSSTLLTCSYQALENYPASIVLAALKNLADAPQLLRSTLGTRDVVNRLTQGIGDLRLGTMVENAKQTENGVEVRFNGQVEFFDHLIVATQASHAHRIAPDTSAQSALESFHYEDVHVVVHRDEALMPAKRSDWSTFNMISANDSATAMCSVYLNQFHDEWSLETPVFQTINPIATPDPDSVISSAALQRPVVKNESKGSWEQLKDYHHRGSTIWFVGSYAVAGVPLLESGVKSSESVVQQILNSSQVVAAES
jgi:predicted NAD/FAD-binding protein